MAERSWRSHLGFAQHALSFELQFTEDGQVDEVALKDSTLEDQGLEACMAGVLRSLSMDDLPMRRSDNGSRDPVVPESRALLGQEEVFLCLASPPCLLTLGLFVGAAFLTVQIYVHAAQSSTIAKPWAGPMATSVPTVAPVGEKYDRCMPLAVECLEKPMQPAWNRERFGNRKNCKDCLYECYNHEGKWPDYKCPRN